jgi:hypothetical protein
MFSRQPKCAFCHRSQADVAKLVSGGRVYICDDCVTEAHRIIHAPDDDVRPLIAWPRPTAGQMVSKLLRALRRRFSGGRRAGLARRGPLRHSVSQ